MSAHLYSPKAETFTFLVEEWDREDLHVVRVHAAAQNVVVAIAAYEAVLTQYPNRRMRLRQSGRVIRE